ncbi:hypothetical protein DFH07DRAFT_390940 [Mycena maculata]|uniref:Uncharacterized protein n=1 Tax=Mycena maculata TaxID=230809 RepID=A0AAD7KAS4_9AGAR|nr:hypothetical protein DFH07DRAFT_390940 [Mycena maculata]
MFVENGPRFVVYNLPPTSSTARGTSFISIKQNRRCSGRCSTGKILASSPQLSAVRSKSRCAGNRRAGGQLDDHLRRHPHRHRWKLRPGYSLPRSSSPRSPAMRATQEPAVSPTFPQLVMFGLGLAFKPRLWLGLPGLWLVQPEAKAQALG